MDGVGKTSALLGRLRYDYDVPFGLAGCRVALRVVSFGRDGTATPGADLLWTAGRLTSQRARLRLCGQVVIGNDHVHRHFLRPLIVTYLYRPQSTTIDLRSAQARQLVVPRTRTEI